MVSAGGYVTRVAATLGALEGRASVRVNVDAHPMPMRPDDAARLALIASEALSNTLRHAFEGWAEGLVEVRLKTLGGDGLRPTIADDGVGMGEAIWPREGELGARIVRSLVSQLRGRLEMASGGTGTTVTLELSHALPTAVHESGARRIVRADDAVNRGSDGTAPSRR